ncbi:two-component sensory box histidine kinase [Desulforapulum autotrophicum HRM2]|uniref:histidine kinase n=1 Tax=Desulforapulum autotrophicum (strain ATCC 43914 / DSM 3382 / VKM B-1955 / HRM2) TaxID=177437 RepID=C0QAV0_DESAH|nr:sensor histidine kinase [Desulforapulum autotrophicum]ACN16883.1 two-component sensory box histidine kinase [Desulforapulum autotrophicum HRM2]
MKQDKPNTIKRMLVFRLLMLPMVVLLLVCATIAFYLINYSGNQIKNELMRTAADHRNLIDCFFAEKKATLKFIIESNTLASMSDNTFLKKLLKNLQTESKAFVDLGVFDENGNHLAYAGPYDLAGKNYGDTPWFKGLRDKGVYISDEFMGFRNVPHFIIAVKRMDNSRTWYVRATIDTYFFNDLVENIRIGKTGEAYIVNSNGIFQTRRRSGGRLMEQDTEFNLYTTAKHAAASFCAGGRFNLEHLYAAVPLKQKNWTLVVRQATTDAFAPIAISALISFLIIAGGGAAVAVTGYIMASNMANRLKIADVEKREMTTQLIIAGKLAEVGEMSTGIAHEINNPLQIMKAELAMIEELFMDLVPLMDKGAEEIMAQVKDSFDQIGIQIQRCATITRGLLNFARKTDHKLTPVKIQTLLPQIVQMVDHRARVEDIRIVQEMDPDLPEIMSDANQLQQVFLNLLNNSIYALEQRSQGEIRINAVKNSADIIIRFSDNGCGFSRETMEKAFLPFFTTKPVGKGTGLGLSTVYGIIKGLGGEITLTSELNQGSTFTIRLPLNVKDQSHETA